MVMRVMGVMGFGKRGVWFNGGSGIMQKRRRKRDGIYPLIYNGARSY